MLSFSDVVAMSLSCDERRWRQQRFLEYRALLAATQWLVSTFSCFFSCFIGPDKLFAKFASCHSRQFCWNFCKLSFWPTFTQKVLPDDFFCKLWQPFATFIWLQIIVLQTLYGGQAKSVRVVSKWMVSVVKLVLVVGVVSVVKVAGVVEVVWVVGLVTVDRVAISQNDKHSEKNMVFTSF